MSIETVGRRHYLIGLPFAQRNAAKSRGCKWDPERKAWWTGKRDVADAVHGAVGDAPANGNGGYQDETGDDLKVIGRANYKGRNYLLVWEGTTRYGHGFKLAFRDGSKVFWARGEVTVTKRYEEPLTVGQLRRFAERMQQDRKAAEARGSDYETDYGWRGNGCGECTRLQDWCSRCAFDEFDN